MEEISESLQATKHKKSVSFSSSIGKQQLASDFDDYIVSEESQIDPIFLKLIQSVNLCRTQKVVKLKWSNNQKTSLN